MEKIEQRKNELIKQIESKLPDFVRSIKGTDADTVILHQDSFAADYQDSEYALLGMAIKYAGIHNKQIQIIGKNRETLK